MWLSIVTATTCLGAGGEICLTGLKSIVAKVLLTPLEISKKMIQNNDGGENFLRPLQEGIGIDEPSLMLKFGESVDSPPSGRVLIGVTVGRSCSISCLFGCSRGILFGTSNTLLVPAAVVIFSSSSGRPFCTLSAASEAKDRLTKCGSQAQESIHLSQ